VTWRHYLQVQTRNPAFLWRMVIAILATGVVAGLAVDAAMPAWIKLDDAGEVVDIKPNPDTYEWRRLESLADDGEWRSVWAGVPRAVIRTWDEWGVTSLAVLTGVCWLAFVLQAIQFRSFSDGRFWLPFIGLLLGVLSIWPTVFLIFYQERVWGIEDSEETISGLRFFIAGVAFREELSKFVCFLPLLPWCVRQRDELAALLVAGSVGLGFAMEENVTYIGGTLGTATLVRLLMPAPFHMALTGLIGLAAYRACIWPKQCGPQFFAWFGVMVLAHGLYNSFSLPALSDYAIVTPLIFVFVIYQFFRELRPNQKLKVEPISLTANFLFCVSTVAAATFVYLCAAVGWQMAGDVLVAGIAGQSIMVYLFLREMPERLVSV
jgi:RsiW-degrading membrane proteinase PrsW (M82 family)